MTNATTYKTLDIAIGDFILDSITPGNVSGYEKITNVTSALDSTTQRFVYTITTATHTIVGDYGTIVINSVTSNPPSPTIRTWVVGQNATSL